MGGGGIPSDYLVSTELQLWLFCCWGCGCSWSVTISTSQNGVTPVGRISVISNDISSDKSQCSENKF